MIDKLLIHGLNNRSISSFWERIEANDANMNIKYLDLTASNSSVGGSTPTK